MASKRIFVAGHRGMVGSAIVRELERESTNLIITADRDILDLTNQAQVSEFFATNKIDEVYLAAAKVGGIHANNTYPAEFIYQNLMIEANIINAAHLNDVQKLLFLGSSCIYPKNAQQPMSETALLTGTLEPTNEPYAIAKIAGIKLCESYRRQYGRDYRSVMPTNLYGPGDNYHPENSHVIPGLLHRFHQAKMNGDQIVTAWGSGSPRREFLFVDDMALASIFIMHQSVERLAEVTAPMCSHINIGTGEDCSIKELTELVSKTVGYKGAVEWDETKPDGAPRKLLNVKTLSELGWRPKTSLKDGLNLAYRAYMKKVRT